MNINGVEFKNVPAEIANEWRQWQDMQGRARLLSDADLKRHATVSINSNHQCVQCFTCACVTVRHERDRNAAILRANRKGGAK